MEVARGEGSAGGDVGEADERVHQRELPRVIECAPGNAFAMGHPRRFGALAQLAAADERREDVLRDGEIRIGHGRYRVTELRQRLDRFRHAESSDIVRGGLRMRVGSRAFRMTTTRSSVARR